MVSKTNCDIQKQWKKEIEKGQVRKNKRNVLEYSKGRSLFITYLSDLDLLSLI